jgi:uncharacterized protein YjbI with pentapeptide repeats
VKTLKPQRLSVMTRVFDSGKRTYLVVTVMAMFPFGAPRHLTHEVSLWKTAMGALPPGSVLDLGMPKPRGELLVSGSAFAPGKVARPVCAVRARLGAIDKTLYVIGDRRWGFGGATEPEPFLTMPITWERAFGGEGYAENPLGVGLSKGDGEGRPLPNIEDPARLVKTPGDRPPPAGFGAYDITWPQRARRLGTYDQAWAEERYPGVARDFDLEAFNTAPDDQRIDGAFRGDEPFCVENMHEERPLLEGRLPGLAARVFFTQRTPAGDALREPTMRLDTVHLFPNAEMGLLIFRGMLDIEEDDAADVVSLLAACEELGAPRPVAHYERVLAQRLDTKEAYKHVLRDDDLLPPRPEGPAPGTDESEMSDLVATEGLARRNARLGAQREREGARARLREQGLDPDRYGPPPLPPEEPPPAADQLGTFVAQASTALEAQQASAADEKAKAEREARELFARSGLDYDAAVTKARKDAAGPPKFSAARELERLRDVATMARNGGVGMPDVEAQLADPRLEPRLRSLEERLVEAYRRFGHLGAEADPMAGDDSTRARDAVIAALAARESLAGRDLTGADLSGLDLRGASLRGAFLEAASLAGADLTGADLTDAVLVRADLTGATLVEVKAARANLGGARLARARLDRAKLAGAIFTGADLTDAGFCGAELERADLSEAKVARTDLGGASAQRLQILRTDLRGLLCAGADLRRAVLLEVDVSGVDFSGADLTSAVFLTARADGAIFRGATLDNVRVVERSSLRGVDLTGASMKQANLRGTAMAGAILTEALLEQVDLSECDLTGARLERARAREARFVRADLTGARLSQIDLLSAFLTKARLAGADFSGASLFRADLSGAKGDADTRFDGANVKQVRVTQRNGRGTGGLRP